MKRLIKTPIVKLKNQIKKYPKIKNKIIYVLNYFPNLKIRLRGVTSQNVIYENWNSTRLNNEFLIDVSHLYKEDLKTGIQRVVRSVLNYLEKDKNIELDIQPIYLTDEDGYWCYKYVKELGKIVVPKKGDVFLGLDLNGAIYAPDEMGLFKDWKNREVKMHFVVYDILPIQFPHFWTPDASIAHELWLETTIKYSSKLICISKAVADDVKKYIEQNKNKFENSPKVEWFHLGADIESSQPSNGLPVEADKFLEKLQNSKSFLMVSTVEPRKGHKQTLKAFEQLWNSGEDVLLVVVGKIGWMMDDFAFKARNHPQKNKKLFWLEGISDEYLNKIYESSTCLIASSQGEGFGLPLIEAAQKKKPIIARDIPVFREVAGKFSYYFNNENNPEVLVEAIAEWLKLYEEDNHIKSDKMPWLTWDESSRLLINKITKKENSGNAKNDD